MKEILRLEKVCKQYSDKSYTINVLDGLDLSIEATDTIAITGKSGSGKSTLLHIMGLLDDADSGQIWFYDKLVSAKDRHIEAFRNKHIGFVFQFHYLLADFTAVENVALPSVIAGNNWSDAKAHAAELLSELNMAERLSHFPNQLSGGEQQRVAIARAMINSPDIIIADEPTGNLDKKHSDEIISIFERLNSERGQTIVLATHDIDIASRMKRHYHLENGHIETAPPLPPPTAVGGAIQSPPLPPPADTGGAERTTPHPPFASSVGTDHQQ